MNTQRFTFEFEQEEAIVRAALRTAVPKMGTPAKGTGWAVLIKLIHCIVLGFGALGVGIALEYLASGQLRLTIWSCAMGIVLLYVAVFGSIFVTLPQLARRALASRANRGSVRMTLDASGVKTQMDHFENHIKWSGFDAISRNKLAFVFWLGLNRVSLPFAAIGSATDIDAVEQAVNTWMEASR